MHIKVPDRRFPSFIPEFISRLPSITTLSPLTVPDLRRILTDVKGSLLSQYQALFGYSGVEIRFTSAALDAVCRKAAERGGGARGLRGIMVIESLAALAVGLIDGHCRKRSYLNQCMKYREFFVLSYTCLHSDQCFRGSVGNHSAHNPESNTVL